MADQYRDFEEDLAEYNLRQRQQEAKEYIESAEFGNLLMVLPTGYGKTLPAKMIINQKQKNGERVILSSPLKALTSEQVEDFQRYWGVAEITGDTGTRFDEENLSKYDVYVFTYEKLKSIMLSKQKRDLFFEFLNVSTVIFDEIHSVGDKSRGSNLESLILMLKRMYALEVDVTGLSATIANKEEFATWLGAKLICADQSERPIPLKIDLVSWRKTFKNFADEMTRVQIMKDYVTKYPKSKCICFCTSTGRTKSFALAMAGMDTRSTIPNSQLLKILAKRGIGFHYAGLTREDKAFVEDKFRNDPDYTFVAATTTLSAGVNFPTDICFIVDLEFYDYWKSESVLMDRNLLHQMMGRAGRPGMSKFGLSVVMAHQEIFPDVKEMVQGTMEVRSHVKANLKRVIIEYLVAFVEDRNMLIDMVESSLDKIDRVIIEAAIEWLAKNNFMVDDKESDRVLVTDLGKSTAFSFIQPETALHILEVNEKIGKDFKVTDRDSVVNIFNLLYNTDEFLMNVNVKSQKSDRLSVMIANSMHPFDDDRIGKTFVFNFKEYLRKIGKLSEDAWKSIIVTPGEKYNIKRELSRFTRAASMICKGNQGVYKTLEMVNNAGDLDLEVIKLSELPGIGEKKIDLLLGAGIKNITEFYMKETSYLSKLLSMSGERVEAAKQRAIELY